MHVLMPQATFPSARVAAESLQDAGHVVHLCHDPAERGFSCAALRGRPCPMEVAPIDVALVVRGAPSPEPHRLEDGAMCAVRRKVPLVVAGSLVGNPFRRWAATEHAGFDATSAVERIAKEPLPEHTEVATGVLVHVLVHGGHEPAHALAEVTRVHGGLRVQFDVKPQPPRRLVETAAVRVVGAVREVDPWAASIDVVLA